MNSLQFSIIIPTYNRGHLIANTVEKVLSQKCEDWELIIVDDGSIDNTSEVLKPYLLDSRIRYIYKKNGGPSSARNVGLIEAKGRIITYVDSDDQVFPDYLVKANDAFKQFSEMTFALVNGNHRLELYDELGHLQATKEMGFTYNFIPKVQDFYDWKAKSAVGTGFFFRNNFQNKVKWNETFSPLEELDFLMQFFVLNPDGFLFIPDVLYEYVQRWGTDGVCSNSSYLQWAQSFQHIYDLHKNDSLMRSPEIFLDRVKKYQELHRLFILGKAVPPIYRHFSEYYSTLASSSPMESKE